MYAVASGSKPDQDPLTHTGAILWGEVLLAKNYSDGGNSAVPNIQRVAKEGVRLKDNFCTAPKYAPSRKSVLNTYRSLYQTE